MVQSFLVFILGCFVVAKKPLSVFTIVCFLLGERSTVMGRQGRSLPSGAAAAAVRERHGDVPSWRREIRRNGGDLTVNPGWFLPLRLLQFPENLLTY